MEKDNNLLHLPTNRTIQPVNQDYPPNYSPMNEDDSFDNGRSIREYFNIVYKRLPIIVAMTIVTTATVAFYMYKQPSNFMALTQMIIEPRKPSQTNKDININFTGNDLNYYSTQLLLLQSPELMRAAVLRLNLQRDPNLLGTPTKGVTGTLRSMFASEKNIQSREASLPVLTETQDATNTEETPLTLEERDRLDRYAATFSGGLVVEQKDRTNLVNISVQSTNPDAAAKVANAVAETFIEQDSDRATQGAKKSLADLSKSIDDLKSTIAAQSQQLIIEQGRYHLPLTGAPGQDFAASRLKSISEQLLAAKDKRRNLEADLAAAIKANNNGEIFAVLGKDASIQDMRKQMADQKAKLEDRIQKLNADIQELNAKKAQLLVKYTEEYRDVVAITEEIKKREEILKKTQAENEQSIASTETKVRGDVAKEVLTGMRAQLASAQNQEAQLQSAFNAELASANQAGVAETRLTTLTREIETSRQLLDTLTQRQKEQELTVASTKPDNLKIMASAQRPMTPIGPNRNRNIFIAFLLSLAAGIGLAFLLDYLDDSIKSSDDVGRYLGLPTLALIPYQSGNEKRRLSLGSGNGASNTSVALVALEDNRSPVAEAYRHLRTSLLFSSAGKPPQTILVTSSQPAEGKTTTAINTAITLAQSGAEVVLIDCDLRRPRLHSHFNLENSTGLTNYLSGDRSTENLLKPFPNLPQLKIITSGPIPPNPAELLSSNEMKNLLQFLKGNFRHVVIDSPPAISFTDAAILSTLVDGVVLVAMAGKSSVHLMRRFKQRLSNIGARIYGVVLNGIKANSADYSYYGYGYTYNYYAPESDDHSTPLMDEVVSSHERER